MIKYVFMFTVLTAMSAGALAHSIDDAATKSMMGTTLKGECRITGAGATGKSLGTFAMKYSETDGCPDVQIPLDKFLPGEQAIGIEYQGRDGGTPTIYNGHAIFMIEGPHIGSHVEAFFDYEHAYVSCTAEIVK